MHQRTIICDPVFVTSGIYGRTTVQYGDSCMSQRKVYKLMEEV